MSSLELCMPVSNQIQQNLDMLFQRKSEALSSMESLETEEETFLRNNSSSLDYSEDNQSESTDIEEEECNYILISSRSDNQFTLRLNQEIQRLSENQLINQLFNQPKSF